MLGSEKIVFGIKYSVLSLQTWQENVLTSCQKYPIVSWVQILKHRLKQQSFVAVTSPFHPPPDMKFSSYITLSKSNDTLYKSLYGTYET